MPTLLALEGRYARVCGVVGFRNAGIGLALNGARS
jgi:hypothetical protein